MFMLAVMLRFVGAEAIMCCLGVPDLTEGIVHYIASLIAIAF